MKKAGTRTLLVDILFDIMGCLVFSVSLQCFSAPNNIAPGGASGIAVLLNYLFGLPVALGNLLINLPLIALAWMFLGLRFTLRTVKTVAILTVLLQLCSGLPPYQGDMILAALYGGVLEGIGLGLVFVRSSTTGGTDIATRLIQLKFPYLPVGQLMIFVNGLVLIASAIVYRSIENALYAMIVIFVGGQIIDTMVYGADKGKVMMVVSKHYQELVDRIRDDLGRGCTLLEAKGGYLGHSDPVLLCAVRKQQLVELKQLVWAVDARAFIVALDATEIIGNGFKEDVG